MSRAHEACPYSTGHARQHRGHAHRRRGDRRASRPRDALAGAAGRAVARRATSCRRPRRLSRVIVPPIASTRSLRPSRPEPRPASAPPTPSSRTATRRAAVAHLDLDLHLRRARVLGRVRQRLRDDVVGRHLDRTPAAAHRSHVELDRNRRPVRERLERRAEPALGEDRRMEPECDLPQSVEGCREPFGDVGQLVSMLAQLLRHGSPAPPAPRAPARRAAAARRRAGRARSGAGSRRPWRRFARVRRRARRGSRRWRSPSRRAP